mmetsp:Transcript_68728/g.188556  ORF Transcript_68728/g.188556 Transcript_68728/m.188556 type:complete len:281 (+) Transcript_68728:1264-2106(+)
MHIERAHVLPQPWAHSLECGHLLEDANDAAAAIVEHVGCAVDAQHLLVLAAEHAYQADDLDLAARLCCAAIVEKREDHRVARTREGDAGGCLEGAAFNCLAQTNARLPRMRCKGGDLLGTADDEVGRRPGWDQLVRVVLAATDRDNARIVRLVPIAKVAQVSLDLRRESWLEAILRLALASLPPYSRIAHERDVATELLRDCKRRRERGLLGGWVGRRLDALGLIGLLGLQADFKYAFDPHASGDPRTRSCTVAEWQRGLAVLRILVTVLLHRLCARRRR